MKLKQETRVLRRKALSSLTVATTAFNSPNDEGRVTQVLLNLQHSFEMLLKAALVQNGVQVFDKKLGRSLGFEKCLNLSTAEPAIKLTEAEAGTLRAIDAMRDDEQHWFNEVSEQLLYVYARATITLFDELLQRVFGEHLADHLPSRVLPLSVDPPRELDVLIDEEYSQIAELLKPGRRARHEARARIRTLLAMEAHVEPDAQVSAKDVDRVERGIKARQARAEVFPRLNGVTARVEGTAVNVTVHFSKKEGAPVHYVSDESVEAAGIREVDLNRKYYMPATELAQKLGLTSARSTALRRHMGIDDDARAHYVFVLGSQHISRYSDAAFTKMRDVLREIDMTAVWEGHKPLGRSRTPRTCTAPGCAATG
ncbi:DUF3644 domain-containing protein [Rhodococcus sp. Q]|uniref:DUF3644 domain-containing protein n=1 Tax=Rhodococcus sp. Q TaxID=2502252 RepID=UPI0010F6399A|nr:DUF3644 domain-containing protein [Rhodococcus sp. Q]